MGLASRRRFSRAVVVAVVATVLSAGEPAVAATTGECPGVGPVRPVDVSPRFESGLQILKPHLKGDTLCFRVLNKTVPRYVDIFVEGVLKDGTVVDLGRLGHLNPTQHNVLWGTEDFLLLLQGEWETDREFRIRKGRWDVAPAYGERPFTVVGFSRYTEIRVGGYGLGFGGDLDLTAEEFGRVLMPAALTVSVELFGRLKNVTKTASDWRPAPAEGVSITPMSARQFFEKLVEPFREPAKKRELLARFIEDPDGFADHLQAEVFKRVVELGTEEPEVYLGVLARLGFDQFLDLERIARRIGKHGVKRVLHGLKIVETVTGVWDFMNLSRARPVTVFRIVGRHPPAHLFLIDTSESMLLGDRISDARDTALTEIERLGRSQENEGRGAAVAVLSFAGSCDPASSTRTIVEFTTDLGEAAATISRRLPEPDGRTPLPQAVRLAERKLDHFLRSTGRKEGRLILLSDGRSTCGPARPSGVFSSAWPSSREAEGEIRFNTIGFHLEPGSAAERDLQYLASSHGGSYFSADSRRRLSRAFEKSLDRPRAKMNLGSGGVKPLERVLFAEGLLALDTEDEERSVAGFGALLEYRPTDPAAHYNLALALDASGHYLEAAGHYRRYLELAPEAPDRTEVEREIRLLRQDHRDHHAHQVVVLRSELEYLERYYQSLFHRANTDLAVEFAGFVREKKELYARLPKRLGIEEPWLERAAEDLSTGLARIAARLGEPTFDRDAVSLLAPPIGRLEEIVERLEQRYENGVEQKHD